MFSLPCGEPSAEPRSSPANQSPAARFDLARSSGATGLDLDEQNAAYVALPRLSTVGDPMPRGFQLAGSGVGRLPGRPGRDNRPRGRGSWPPRIRPAGPRSGSSSTWPRSGGCRSRSRWRVLRRLRGAHQRDQAGARLGRVRRRRGARRQPPSVDPRRRRGGADPARGSGLIGLRDRAEARGGSLEVSSPPGEGTLILVLLPLRLH
jgi:hypothetical protein